MNRNLTRSFLLAVASLCASHAQAAFVQWDIDSSVSKMSLAIPDQVIQIDSTTATARVRNQIGTSNSWSVGNVAAVDGFLNTFYRETATSGVHDIQFTTNPVGQFVGLNSGNYRPNPAVYNTAVTSTANPDGTYANISVTAGVFGFKVRSAVIPEITDVFYTSLFNTSFDATSGVVPVSGATGGGFSVSTLQGGILDSGLAIDGLSVLLVGQVVPDSLGTLPSSMGTAFTGSATITDLGGNNRRLNWSVQIPITITMDGIAVPAFLTSSMQAFATVPEPTTWSLASFGLAIIAWRACRLRRMT